MNAWRDRQENVESLFGQDKELKRTFRDARGVNKRIHAAVQKYALNDYDLQRTISESAVSDALQGKPVYQPVAYVLSELLSDVARDPRPWCEPPDVPDAFDDWREPALEYATSNWWYDMLSLGELGAKASSWQTTMSRGGNPRGWAEIRERLRAWRARVMKALDMWELRALERDNPDLEQSHVKDAYDRHGLLAAARVARRFQEYENLAWGSTRGFDPAEPDRAQFDVYDFRFDAKRLRDMIDQDFPKYRSRVGSDFQELAQERLEAFSDDWRDQWECLVEVERNGKWNPATRSHDVDSRYRRIQVKKDPRHAADGEEIKMRKARVRDPETGEWTRGWEHWVWRWREVDEYDEIGAGQVRDKVMMLCAKDDNLDVNMFMRPAAGPIEADGLGRVYSRD